MLIYINVHCPRMHHMIVGDDYDTCIVTVYGSFDELHHTLWAGSALIKFMHDNCQQRNILLQLLMWTHNFVSYLSTHQRATQHLTSTCGVFSVYLTSCKIYIGITNYIKTTFFGLPKIKVWLTFEVPKYSFDILQMWFFFISLISCT